MPYPKYLLPRKYFRIFSLDELDPSKEYHLVRRSLKQTAQDTFDNFGLLKIGSLVAIDENSKKGFINQVPGMSKCMLGGLFYSLHLKYRAKNVAMDDWEKDGPPIQFKELIKHIEVQPNPISIYFPLHQIHRKEIPFVLDQKNREYKKKLPQQLTQSSTKINLSAMVELLHKPTNSNFWHVELHIKDLMTDNYFKSQQVAKIISEEPIDQQKHGNQVANSVLENILMVNGKAKIIKRAIMPIGVYLKPIFFLIQQGKYLKHRLQAV